jgi:hypothetical protein
MPGVPYWVGERGPEPFVPDVPGTIIPHGAMGTAAAAAPVINQSIVINTNGGGTPAQNRDMAEKAGEAFRRSMRQEVEGILVTHMRDRGLFKPNLVS